MNEPFASPTEANIEDKLRKIYPELLSLVALASDEVVGHILISLQKSKAAKNHRRQGSAAVAVSPVWQRQVWHNRSIEA